MQKFKIKVIALFSLCLFQFTFPMGKDELIEDEHMKAFHLTQKTSKCLTELDCELLSIILSHLINFEESLCKNIFDKIIKSYQSIKTFSLVCKKFRKLEETQMEGYKTQLLEKLADNLISTELNKTDDFNSPDIFFFPNFIKDLAEDKSMDYSKMLSWICSKKSKPLKALLIFLRLKLTNTEDFRGKSEQDILKNIWSKFKDIRPLHLACQQGNVELTKYLTEPNIRSYFDIDINEKNLRGQTPLELTILSKKNSTTRPRYMGRSPEQNEQLCKHYEEIVKILKEANAEES